MTTGLISGVSSIADLTNVINASSKAGQETQGSFSDVLKANSVGQDTEKTEKTNDRNGNGISKEGAGAKKADTKAYTKAEEKVQKSEEIKNPDEVSDEVMAAAAQAMQAVAQILNVEVEDVAAALEALGLTETDLLDTTNIPELLVEITGAENTLDIMTDEGLFNSLKDVTKEIDGILDDLMTETNLTEDELKDVFAKLGSEENAGIGETAELKVDIATERNVSKDDNQNESAGSQMNWTENVVDSIKTAAEQNSEVPLTYSTDMEEIYNQVSESMKLNLSEDVTEMEINLHPASLGNVKIQISARDGMVTANFTTQNETVKAALETQIIQLKDNMAEQGIKVEAIEVSVAAHAFEENLSKEGDSSNSGETETKRKRRSINLNEIDENDDINIVEDEIRIAREMMAHNGTTVDYMA